MFGAARSSIRSEDVFLRFFGWTVSLNICHLSVSEREYRTRYPMSRGKASGVRNCAVATGSGFRVAKHLPCGK